MQTYALFSNNALSSDEEDFRLSGLVVRAHDYLNAESLKLQRSIHQWIKLSNWVKVLVHRNTHFKCNTLPKSLNYKNNIPLHTQNPIYRTGSGSYSTYLVHYETYNNIIGPAVSNKLPPGNQISTASSAISNRVTILLQSVNQVQLLNGLQPGPDGNLFTIWTLFNSNYLLETSYTDNHIKCVT